MTFSSVFPINLDISVILLNLWLRKRVILLFDQNLLSLNHLLSRKIVLFFLLSTHTECVTITSHHLTVTSFGPHELARLGKMEHIEKLLPFHLQM
jgi:hypothetical protein